MALLLTRIEGFDGPINGADGLSISTVADPHRIRGISGSNVAGDHRFRHYLTDGRGGGGCIALKNTSGAALSANEARHALVATYRGNAPNAALASNFIGSRVGFAFKFTGSLSTAHTWLYSYLNASGTFLFAVGLRFNTTDYNRWQLVGAETTSVRRFEYDFPDLTVFMGRWYYIEVAISELRNSTSTPSKRAAAWVDGVLIGDTTFTGSTSPVTTSASVADRIFINRGPGLSGNVGHSSTVNTGSEHYYDDYYVQAYDRDDPNLFVPWGDTRVLYRPANADGFNDGWTPSSGSDRYAMVDDPGEATHDGDTTYVQADTFGSRGGFLFEEPATLPEKIHAVQPVAAVRRSADDSRVVRTYCRVDGTNYDTPNEGKYVVSPPETHYVGALDSDTFVNNPATGLPWTNDELRTAEFGLFLQT
jgi:hypothetical protein